MKTFLHSYLLIAYLVFGSVTGKAAVVLPADIQDCIDSGTCSNPVIAQTNSTHTVYNFVDSGIQKYLFAYRLSPQSSETTNFSSTAFSGVAFVSANASYDLTQNLHSFKLYLDQVSPTPINIWLGASDGLNLELRMPTSDLLAGSSFHHTGDSGTGNYFDHGNLETVGDLDPDYGLVVCLDVTCEIGATFHLLNMQFVQSGNQAILQLNANDSRPYLYSQFRDYYYDPGWYVAQSYRVIPVPSALILFSSALIVFLTTCRRSVFQRCLSRIVRSQRIPQ